MRCFRPILCFMPPFPVQFSKMQKTRPLFVLLSYVHSLKANKLVEPEAFFISFGPPVLTLLWARLHLLSITPSSLLCPAPPSLRLICWSFYFTVSLSQLRCCHFISSLSVCWVFFFLFKSPAPQILTAPSGLIQISKLRPLSIGQRHTCRTSSLLSISSSDGRSSPDLLGRPCHVFLRSVFSSPASLQAALWSDWQTVDVQNISISCLLIYMQLCVRLVVNKHGAG